MEDIPRGPLKETSLLPRILLSAGKYSDAQGSQPSYRGQEGTHIRHLDHCARTRK
jgi:hypothetical protein